MSNLKRFLALTLAMLMVVGAMAVSAKSFTDVASTDSYAEAVDVLSEIGVIAGTSTDEFSPDALVERQQMAMFIARLATAQPSWFAVEAAAVFADQKDPTYNAAIAYASTNGFVKGTDTAKNLFDGTASVTLQEAATMLCRVLGYTTEAMDKAYPMSYLTMADDVGLLAGLEDVVPTAALTRGEVATMLYNAFMAPMATTYLTSNSTGGVVVNVSIPEDLLTAKRLMTTKWKFSIVNDAIVANQKFAFSGSNITVPSKNNANPVEFDVLGLANFNDFAKYLPTDSTPESLLGVELELTYWRNKLMKVEVVGSKTATINATVSDAGVVTVDGTAYNLDVYPNTDPTLGDNCFWQYNGANKIVRMDFATDNAAAVKTKFAGITNGFFTMEVINAGLPSQMIVYKPQLIGLVVADGAADADTTIEISGIGNITANAVNAVVGDYVAYTYGGFNLLEVNAVAIKTTNDKILQINSNATATLASGLIVPISGTNMQPLNVTADLGKGLDVYKINNTVIMTAFTPAAPTVYSPKSYYKVLQVADRIDSFDGFTHIYTYKIQVLNDAGTVSTLTITHINDAELATATDYDLVALTDNILVANWNSVTSKDALKDKYITVVGQKIYTALNAEFYGTGDATVIPTGITKLSTNVYELTGVGIAMTTPATKMIIKGNDTTATYKTFSGTAFTALGAGVTLNNVNVVWHTNGTVKEIVYFYAEANVAAAAILGTAPVTTSPEVFLFNSWVNTTATTITYNALNVKTGETLTKVFTNAAGDTAIPTEVTSGATSPLYIAGANAPAVYDPTADDGTGNADTSTIVTASATIHASGVIVTATNVYTTTNTKFYKYDATALKFVATDAATIGAAAFNATIVVNNNNATYVIVR